MKIDISSLTKMELESIICLANFSKDQEAIFRALNADERYDYAIQADLGMSARRYYRLKKIVWQKSARIAQELGIKIDMK